jgi:hypothetical protein
LLNQDLFFVTLVAAIAFEVAIGMNNGLSHVSSNIWV